MKRREFLGAAAAGVALAASAQEPERKAASLPRWRGFNLHPFFGTWNSGIPLEEDFAIVAELGFNFVRLPAWYTLWTDPRDWRKVKEEALANVDNAVEMGRRHGLHVNLCLHRAPGYCVAKNPPEPFDLFKDAEAVEAFCFQWEMLARRYAEVPADALSFNLVNEPVATREQYEPVARAAAQVIRGISPTRIIISDGLFYGRQPVPQLADLNLVQSIHCYDPHQLTHYGADWAEGAGDYPEPTWPVVRDGKEVYGRRNLELGLRPWTKLQNSGQAVHCGEIGCFNKTPHPVAMAWFRDMLALLKERGIGYALWELRGPFGIFNSERPDVAYEDWKGHKLDRELLELLKES